MGTSVDGLLCSTESASNVLPTVALSTKSLRMMLSRPRSHACHVLFFQGAWSHTHPPVNSTFCFLPPAWATTGPYFRASCSFQRTVPSARQITANYKSTYQSTFAHERRSTDAGSLEGCGVVVCRGTQMYILKVHFPMPTHMRP